MLEKVRFVSIQGPWCPEEGPLKLGASVLWAPTVDGSIWVEEVKARTAGETSQVSQGLPAAKEPALMHTKGST